VSNETDVFVAESAELEPIVVHVLAPAGARWKRRSSDEFV
jgi:hypothetical protein